MPTVNINGLDIHYRENGQGFPVLLIHGFTGNLGNWAFQMPVLSPRFRAVSLDLRGHGHSAKPTQREDYSLELMADDASGLLQHMGIDFAYVVGHSMGGMVAQHLTLSHPDLIAGLVLVDTAAEVPDGVRTKERARLLDVARTEGMEAVFEQQLALNPTPDQLRNNPQFLNIWRQQFLLTSPEAYIYCAEALGRRKSILDELHAIETPTLIVCGENDEPFLGPSRRMHERIAASEMVIIPGAGHTPQVEKASEFNRILLEFLTRAEQGVAAAGG